MARIGLVLGAGGITGEAFHRGVLNALRDEAGWDARTADVVVGTSAGSLVAASLRTPVAHPTPVPRSQPTPIRRIEGLGAFSAAVRRPWRARAGVLATALLPAGGQPIEMVTGGLRRRFGMEWPTDDLWVVAARRRDGRRVVFGQDGSPRADVASAVAASCAIPGYFTPVTIGGETYVDGGVHSPTNADLLAGLGLDLVVVSSPMSVQPGAARPRLDLSLRLMWHRYVMAETRAVRRSGTPVLIVEPDARAVAHMGINAMRGSNVDVIEDAAVAATTAVLRRPANLPKRELLRSGLRSASA